MTESEFLALGPRERDALVAEKVMGLCPHNSSMVEPDTFDGEVSYYWCCWCFDRRSSRHAFDQSRYTTDISAAWQVVEKMQEGGFIGGVYLPDPKAKRYRWYVTIGSISLREGYAAYGDAAPFAICLAALRAKGVMR